MEEDIQNYLSTVMFRGTPCIYPEFKHNRYEGTKCLLHILSSCVIQGVPIKMGIIRQSRLFKELALCYLIYMVNVKLRLPEYILFKR